MGNLLPDSGILQLIMFRLRQKVLQFPDRCIRIAGTCCCSIFCKINFALVVY